MTNPLTAYRQRLRYNQALSAAFRTVFSRGDKQGVEVMGHLRKFCFAEASTLRYDKTGKVDPLATMLAEGMREVWLEIAHYLNFTPEDFAEIDRHYKEQMEHAERTLDN